MTTINIENKRLVNRIKKGQLEFLLQWINQNKDKLYKIAWSYLYNHADIEDVLQDTLIKVYENIHTLKKPNYFETWFISILINECRTRLRKMKREVLKESIEHDGYHLDQYSFFQELNSIDDIYKEVIVLKYISGYSQEEISSILDIPIGTVKSRIYRGLRELRELVKEV
ncbi:MAG: RNA polymerase sigma factor [Tissierellia bacterium]|nr:RNA polymerase sigma factor [Tissierellia bacterium]